MVIMVLEVLSMTYGHGFEARGRELTFPAPGWSKIWQMLRRKGSRTEKKQEQDGRTRPFEPSELREPYSPSGMRWRGGLL
jgi:hypothetical protein